MVAEWFDAHGDTQDVIVMGYDGWPDSIDGLREGPVADNLYKFALDPNREGWWVWADGDDTRVEDDMRWIAEQARADLAERVDLKGGVFPFKTDGRRGFAGYGRVRQCCPTGDLTEVGPPEESSGLWHCSTCGAVVGADFRFETPVEEIVLCDNPDVTLFAAPGPERLADVYEKRQHRTAADYDVVYEQACEGMSNLVEAVTAGMCEEQFTPADGDTREAIREAMSSVVKGIAEMYKDQLSAADYENARKGGWEWMSNRAGPNLRQPEE